MYPRLREPNWYKNWSELSSSFPVLHVYKQDSHQQNKVWRLELRFELPQTEDVTAFVVWTYRDWLPAKTKTSTFSIGLWQSQDARDTAFTELTLNSSLLNKQRKTIFKWKLINRCPPNRTQILESYFKKKDRKPAIITMLHDVKGLTDVHYYI